MFRLHRSFVSIIAVLLAVTMLPASARQPGPFPDPATLEGLQAAVSRSASLDFSAFEMEPEAAGSPEGSEPAYRDVLNLTGFVFEFETGEQAAAGYDAVLANGVEPLVAMLGFENPVLTEGDLDDLGDQAHFSSIFNETASTEGYFRYVVMQQEAYLFLAIVITETEETSLEADALLAHFADESAAGHSGPGTFDAEGGSTDGLWAFFPDASDPLYAGLLPSGDEVLFPAQP